MDPAKPSCSRSYMREVGLYYKGEERESDSPKSNAFETPLAKSEGNGTDSAQSHAIGTPLVKTESLLKDTNVPSTMGTSGEANYMQKVENKTSVLELGVFVDPSDYSTANLQSDPNQPRSSASVINIQDVLEHINAPLIPRESGSANSQKGAYLPNPIIPEDSRSASLPIGASLPVPINPRTLFNANLPVGASLTHPSLNNQPTLIVHPIDITSDRSRGVMKVIGAEGTGVSPAYGDKVAIHYDAYLIVRGNKVPFASDRSQECTKFNLGRGMCYCIICFRFIMLILFFFYVCKIH